VIRCAFASDLHGSIERWSKLLRALREDPPQGLFLGGDLLPSAFLRESALDVGHEDFLNGYVAVELARLRSALGSRYPQVFVILGNDDGRFEEPAVLEIATRGLWTYAHGRRALLGGHAVYGYSYVPPTPFLLKDWERYDVSRYVDPGCISPEEGIRTMPERDADVRHGTIEGDLKQLVQDDDVTGALFLFHGPPYRTSLDRAALDGRTVDHVPLDVHIGSVAVRRFIEERRPLVTLHGHVHESARLTGAWRDRLGPTHLFGAAHDGPELALVRFDLDDPPGATRALL
jgi:Icc-related predicted phosphoesterase